jgi:hypothetical protein
LLPISLPLLLLHYLCYHLFPTVTNAWYLNSKYLNIPVICMSTKYYDEFLLKLASVVRRNICFFFHIHCFVLTNLYYRMTLIKRSLCIISSSSNINHLLPLHRCFCIYHLSSLCLQFLQAQVSVSLMR